MIEILFFIICLNFIYALWHYYSFVNPATTFILGFLGAVLVSILYKNEWGMDKFHLNTFLVLSIGITIYNITCCIVQASYKRPPNLFVHKHSFYSIKRTTLFFIMMTSLSITIWEYYAKMGITKSSSIEEALYLMDYEFKGGDQDFYQLPVLLRNLIFFRDAINYYFFFLLAKMFAFKNYSGSRDVFIICAIGLFGAFLTGSRGNYVTLLLYFFFIISLFRAIISPKTRNISIKRIVVVGMLASLLGYTFVKSTEWVGRDLGEITLSDYFAIYLGAEIKNLDTYMNERQFENKELGEFTFNGISTKSSKDRVRQLHQFRDYNGYLLGNVYTIFQDFYQDFGYLGVVFLTVIMAGIMQWLYAKSFHSPNIFDKPFDIYIFLYAYLSTTVAYSFFSDRFYGKLSWPFIKLFLELLLLSYIIEKKSVKKETVKLIK